MSAKRAVGFRRSRSTARRLPAAGGWLLAGDNDTRGRFTLIEMTVPAGDATPLHLHRTMDESFYVLHGSLAVTCGDGVFDADPGDFVYLPMSVPHRYVAGADGATMLVVASPGGLEDFFDDWESGMGFEALAAEHDIEFLG